MKQKLGLILVALGMLLYLLAFLFGWLTCNTILIIGLLLVLSGTVLHVWLVKNMTD